MIEVSKEDIAEFAHHVLYNREHALVLFSIPKVACTTFKQLFRRMSGVSRWRYRPHHSGDLPLLESLGPAEATTILNSPAWTKAVFLRDPADRFLSAYLDKVVHNLGLAARISGQANTVPSFDEFVARSVGDIPGSNNRIRVGRKSNAHWRPQSYLANLEKFIACCDFVGSFNHLESHTRALLNKVGAWRQYGSIGWGKDNKSNIFQYNDAKNRKNSQAQFFHYYSDELLQAVQHAYRMDYALIESLGLGHLPLIRTVAN